MAGWRGLLWWSAVIANGVLLVLLLAWTVSRADSRPWGVAFATPPFLAVVALIAGRSSRLTHDPSVFD